MNTKSPIPCAPTTSEGHRFTSYLAEHFAPAPRHFAALGTNGRDPVAWGIGRTEEDAREDAIDSGYVIGEDDSADLKIVEIDAARYARIESGEVAADDLWTAS